MELTYDRLKLDLHNELLRILDYWSNHTLDNAHGGFLGRIDAKNIVIPQAPKGIILNTRILWAFSAASRYLKDATYIHICYRAFKYLETYFKDNTYGGVFWELDYKGSPINSRKQIYAQAFAIYALSEYYALTNYEPAKQWAIALFELIEQHAKDQNQQGYTEAFDQDWSPIPDMRLSNKDMNAEKTMNTHLHILEAYTTLLGIYDSPDLKIALKDLIALIQNKFLNSSYNYDLFFDRDWNLQSNTVSYGHNIETAWLVIEAAKALGNASLIQQTQHTAIKVADAFLHEALDHAGAVINEKNTRNNTRDTDRHWWPQMEALIGLKYAYNLTHDVKYSKASIRIWNFTKQHLRDHDNGEWHFRVDKNNTVYLNEDKVSMWKAPYHTSRACIQLQD